jgi:pyridoxamine 5'-phosphate oxidase
MATSKPESPTDAATTDLAAVRREYEHARLADADAGSDPHAFFRRWLDEAIAAKIPEPTAMNLATLGEDGAPRSRIVLLKGWDERGPVFYTDYDGAKGRELTRDPRCALTFHWVEQERQIRLEGRASRVSAEESDRYFHSRPHKSQVAATASPQSQPIERATLEARFAEVAARFPDEVPRPERWGGFRVAVHQFEFWQGRRSRLHDRIRFRLEGGSWLRDRLAP